jgi:hypothetical protein
MIEYFLHQQTLKSICQTGYQYASSTDASGTISFALGTTTQSCFNPILAGGFIIGLVVITIVGIVLVSLMFD